jgi:hypothetical protein
MAQQTDLGGLVLSSVCIHAAPIALPLEKQGDSDNCQDNIHGKLGQIYPSFVRH